MRDLSDNTIESSMKVELARSFAHIFSAFLRHTQELPLYRESMYNLYQNDLNQSIKEDALQEQSMKIVTMSAQLIEQELTLTQGIMREASLPSSAMRHS